MSNNQNIPPGLLQPTLAALPPGAGNPRDAAIIEMKNSNDAQTRVNSIGGKRRRRKYRGGADAVPIPQFQMQYKATGGPGSSPNEQLGPLLSNSMQSTAWAAHDSKAASVGGSRRRCKKGGNSDWIWGCYSGGKRRTKRARGRKNKRKTKRRTHH